MMEARLRQQECEIQKVGTVTSLEAQEHKERQDTLV